jgi:hypothetical protein
MGILKSKEPIFLRLRCDNTTLNHLIESPLGLDQTTADVNCNTCEISVTAGDTHDLRWRLTAQLVYCGILELKWLRNEIELTSASGLSRVRSLSS